MAITLYQEAIPLSNQKVPNPISTQGAYSNPVIISYALDSTIPVNTFETVVYIRNDDVTKYYRNVVVSLMRNGSGSSSPADGVITNNGSLGPVITINGVTLPATFSVEQPPTIPEDGITLSGQYTNITVPIASYVYNGLPISSDESLSVKFSYGYDELSNAEWLAQKDALIIPAIGNISTPDTSYIPIRMRLYWKGSASIYTIRDYHIDISFEMEQSIGSEIL